MDMQVAKWSNSLAFRVPAEVVRRFGLREGDTVQAQITADGTLTLKTVRWNRNAFAHEVAQARETPLMGTQVVDELRGGARY